MASSDPNLLLVASTAACGLAAVGVMYGTTVSRQVKHALYKAGYQNEGGRSAIPGPSEDTRFTRFSEGYRITQEYRQRYGQLYRVFCGDIPEIVLTDPEDVKVYYSGDGKVHLKKPNIGFGHYIGKVLGQSVGLKHNEDWKRIRSHVDGHFSSAFAVESLPTMIADVAEWLDQLPELPIAKPTSLVNSKGAFEVDAVNLTSELPFKMIARRLFGDLLDDALFAELYGHNTVHERIMTAAFFGNLEQWRLAEYLPLQSNKDITKFEHEWAELLHRLAREAKEKGVSCTVTEMYERVQDGEMSFLEFSHTVDEILFTNIDVTTTSIAWTVTLIAQHPDFQARLVAEIKAALADETAGSTIEERREAYLRKTDTLVHYCYLESGRVRPILFYSLPEVTAEPKIINGYYIPAKQSVLIDPLSLNRYSPVWEPDGEAFRPERFATLSPMQYRYSFWRFGIGPRKCVGQHFGDKIIKSCVTAIFERYQVDVPREVGVLNDRFVHTPDATLVFSPRM